ncbi:MAG: anaerobic ribonucleoside-triphosphate reductase activating protein [Oscillospiraceae bacterium]|nr:anaerobic ribonucleoside-triphosphate reductase activating protein [Oscillospiraceae bacterium]
MARLRLAGVVGDSITDGPGLRTTVFVQGCPHACEGCHNPETHSFEGGYEGDTEELLRQIAKNPLLSGVTFSGGEPFCQAGALAELGEGVKALGLELAAYTGYTFEKLLGSGSGEQKKLLGLLDVLVDGRFVLAERSLELKFKGSRNQRILDVQKSLELGDAVLMLDGRWD